MKTTPTREAKQNDWRDRALKAEARCEQLGSQHLEMARVYRDLQQTAATSIARCEQLEATLAHYRWRPMGEA